MPIEKHRIYYKARGAWMEDEDWIYLVVNSDTGEMYVEKGGSFVSPYPGKRPASSSEVKILIEDFLNGDDDEVHKTKLKSMLAEISS